MTSSAYGNGREPGSLKYPECGSCVKAKQAGRHPLLVNQDHDEAVNKWKEPHIVQGVIA